MYCILCTLSNFIKSNYFYPKYIFMSFGQKTVKKSKFKVDFVPIKITFLITYNIVYSPQNFIFKQHELYMFRVHFFGGIISIHKYANNFAYFLNWFMFHLYFCKIFNGNLFSLCLMDQTSKRLHVFPRDCPSIDCTALDIQSK